MLHPVTTSVHNAPTADALPQLFAVPDMSRLKRLTDADKDETLRFLSIRPAHTVVMSGFIADNGIESDLHRGSFFGYCGVDGRLEGIALIGHSTLVEARSDEALTAFAFAARSSDAPIHLIMSGGDDAHKFWRLMDGTGREPKLVCTETLFEVAFPYPVANCEISIETASIDMLLPIAEAQAEIAFLECGVDPMLRDREGFLRRVARRIENGRVFTVTSGDKLMFKADIIAETPDAIYLEGVYVHPDHRGEGLGSQCLAKLTLALLDRVPSICLLSNTEHKAAHRCFEKAGYRQTDECVTLFV